MAAPYASRVHPADLRGMRVKACCNVAYAHFFSTTSCEAFADREDELLVAQRKIYQLKAGGAVAGIGAGSGTAGVTAGAAAGQLAGSTDTGGSGDAGDSARLHQLLQKRTAELYDREQALMRAERCAMAPIVLAWGWKAGWFSLGAFVQAPMCTVVAPLWTVPLAATLCTR